MKLLSRPLWLLPVLVLASCGRPTVAPPAEKTALHHALAPHGGTPVALGEDYRLEIVRDAASGTLSAYVLDDDMEQFIRCPAAALTINARVEGTDRAITLQAVANPATGEKVGDTSFFQGHADWVKTVDHFTGTLQSLTIRGTAFTAVSFPFPAGDAPD